MISKSSPSVATRKGRKTPRPEEGKNAQGAYYSPYKEETAMHYGTKYSEKKATSPKKKKNEQNKRGHKQLLHRS